MGCQNEEPDTCCHHPTVVSVGMQPADPDNSTANSHDNTFANTHGHA